MKDLYECESCGKVGDDACEMRGHEHQCFKEKQESCDHRFVQFFFYHQLVIEDTIQIGLRCASCLKILDDTNIACTDENAERIAKLFIAE